MTATIGFGLTFRAWDLIAPMSAEYKERLGLTSFEQSLLVAIPVLVGSWAGSRWARSPTNMVRG